MRNGHFWVGYIFHEEIMCFAWLSKERRMANCWLTNVQIHFESRSTKSIGATVFNGIFPAWFRIFWMQQIDHMFRGNRSMKVTFDEAQCKKCKAKSAYIQLVCVTGFAHDLFDRFQCVIYIMFHFHLMSPYNDCCHSFFLFIRCSLCWI